MVILMQVLGVFCAAIGMLPLNFSRLRLRRRFSIFFAGGALTAVFCLLAERPLSVLVPAIWAAFCVLGWASWSWQGRIAADIGSREAFDMPPLVNIHSRRWVPYNPFFAIRYIRRMYRDDFSVKRLQKESFDFDRLFDRFSRRARNRQ